MSQSIESLLAEAESRGVRVEPSGDGLIVQGRAHLKDFIKELNARKQEILDYLNGGPPPDEAELHEFEPPGKPRRPVLSEKALYGLAGRFVRSMLPHSEADSASLLFQFLSMAGIMLGRNGYFKVEGDKHYPRLFISLVGQSAKSRKGTSFGRVTQIIELVDPEFLKRNITSGLGSGQVVIWLVRDPSDRVKKGGELVDEGVSDKRLVVTESELASLLGITNREDSILSAVLRDAWDDKTLRNTAKGSSAIATGSHIGICAHITIEELIRKLSSVEIANGFANRFLWIFCHRSKLLPHGSDPDLGEQDEIANLLREAMRLNTPKRIYRSEAADALWEELYAEMAAEESGIVGSLTARAEAYTMRLALLYCLLDGCDVIEATHLEAGYAAWKYAEDSIRYIWKTPAASDPDFEIISWIAKRGGSVTQDELRASKRIKADEADRIITRLVRSGRGTSEMVTGPKGGRPVRRFTLSEFAKNAQPTHGNPNRVDPSVFEGIGENDHSGNGNGKMGNIRDNPQNPNVSEGMDYREWETETNSQALQRKPK